MMFLKNLLAGLFLMFLLLPSAYAGRVELTTYYPSAYGEYRNLKSTKDSWFATTSGNVGIGTTSPAYKLDVKGSIVNSLPSEGYLALSGDLTGYAANTFPTLRTNATCIYFDVRGVYAGNLCYDTAFNSFPSDAKLKTNITTIGNAFGKLSQIRGVTFAWKDGRDHYARHIGVLAQDVEKVAPELVSQPPTGLKGVSYGGLNALTIEAIKEQQKESHEQQRQIDLLKKEIEELKKQ